MNKMQKIVAAIIFLLVALSIGSASQAGEINFSVKAILPENQRSKQISYFDLRVVPGKSQTLSIELVNETEEDITISASANSAMTNDNGIVDYSYKETKKDSSATITFSEIASIPKEIILPKQSKKIVECVIDLPKKSFDGYILGGLYFEQKETQEDQNKDKSSVSIGNKFSYVIGVLLSENNLDIKPELAFSQVKTTQINGVNAVTTNIQNKQAAMIKKMKVDAKIYYEKEDIPRYEKHQETLTMAPNTNFNLPILLKEQPFVPGNYKIKIVANDGYRDWNWEQEFKITQKEAKKYNDTAINIPPKYKQKTPWVMIISVILLIILVIGLIIYYFKRREKQVLKEKEEIMRKLKDNSK